MVIFAVRYCERMGKGNGGRERGNTFVNHHVPIAVTGSRSHMTVKLNVKASLVLHTANDKSHTPPTVFAVCPVDLCDSKIVVTNT